MVALVEVLVHQGRVKDAMSKGGPDPTDRVPRADLEDPDEHVVILCRDDVIASNLANPAGAVAMHRMSTVVEKQESKPGDGSAYSAACALLTR
jgi:hypothetical protein